MCSDSCAIFLTYYRDYTCKISILQQALLISQIGGDKLSDKWVVQNLENALNVWNEKLTEIWQLITTSPQAFRGGAIWSVGVDIHGALQAIGYALLVLFFVIGMMKTCGRLRSNTGHDPPGRNDN